MATKPEKSKKTDNAETNRLKRLLRTQKKQPNNKQIDAALKTTRMHRKTPANPVWTASWRRTAQLFKLFTGRFDPDIMSSNAEVSRNAMAKPGKYVNQYKPMPVPNDAFSLGARIQGGAASWN